MIRSCLLNAGEEPYSIYILRLNLIRNYHLNAGEEPYIHFEVKFNLSLYLIYIYSFYLGARCRAVNLTTRQIHTGSRYANLKAGLGTAFFYVLNASFFSVLSMQRSFAFFFRVFGDL